MIPPLRDRLSDIRLLSLQFLREAAPDKQFTQDAWSWLLAQPWPGNVRELKSAVQRAAILSDATEIHAKHFFTGSNASSKSGSSSSPQWLGAGDLESAKNVFIMQKIEQALEITSGNRTRAAELLGVTSRTLFRYLEQKTMTEPS
jgi:DNA-binding NtrC family response regulator